MLTRTIDLETFAVTRHSNFERIALIYGLCLAISGTSTADDGQWSQFRGKNGSGVASTTHPSQWSETENLAWTAEIDGGGWSSPVISGRYVFVTTAVSEEFTRPKGFGKGVASMGAFFRSKPPEKPISFEVHCLNLDNGQRLWRKQIISRKPKFKIHPSNSYATESPATNGEHIYAYFAAVGVVTCLDFNGKEIWTRELGAFPTANDFGTGSALALLNDKVFLQCDNESQSFVCALDAKSGKDVWRVERESGTSWSSPVIWRNRDRVELIVCGSKNVASYNPATGDVYWRLSTSGAFSASPTSDEERIYLGKSARTSRGPLIAISAGAKGDLTLDEVGENGVVWVEKTSAPGMSSPVVVDGRVYVISRGVLSCHEASTGERLYRERLENAASVTASLWAAGNHVFVLNESGDTAVIEVGDEFKLDHTNNLPGLYWATPSVAGKSLLVRDAARLHCIRTE